MLKCPHNYAIDDCPFNDCAHSWRSKEPYTKEEINGKRQQLGLPPLTDKQYQGWYGFVIMGQRP